MSLCNEITPAVSFLDFQKYLLLRVEKVDRMRYLKDILKTKNTREVLLQVTFLISGVPVLLFLHV